MKESQIGSFEITRYRAELINGKPKIIDQQHSTHTYRHVSVFIEVWM